MEVFKVHYTKHQSGFQGLSDRDVELFAVKEQSFSEVERAVTQRYSPGGWVEIHSIRHLGSLANF